MHDTSVVVFLFNRPEHTRNLFESIVEAIIGYEFEIEVFIDGPRNRNDETNIRSVLEIVDEFSKKLNLKLHISKVNKGLAQSVINGVSEVLQKKNSVIVLEDDLILHRKYFEFMINCLHKYEKVEFAYAISGYSPLNIYEDYKYQTFLSHRIHSWGWGTWRDRWQGIDWEMLDIGMFLMDKKRVDFFCQGGTDLLPMLKDQLHGNIDSWAIRFNYAMTNSFKYAIYPKQTLVLNRGFDGSGVHCGYNDLIQNQNFEVLFRSDEQFAYHIDLGLSEKIKLYYS